MSELTETGLPTDEKAKAEYLMWDYMFGYFPDAWLAELEVAIEGNKQHNPGESLHWAREKSTDHKNKALRHIWLHSRGEKKDDGGRTWHLAKAIWRLKAMLQLEIEAERKRLREAQLEDDRLLYGTSFELRRPDGASFRIDPRHVYHNETGERVTIDEAARRMFDKNSLDPEAGSS